MVVSNKKKHSPLRHTLTLQNQQGFFQIFGVLFVPILMSAMLATAQISYTLLQIQKKQHICLEHTLKAQSQLRVLLSKITHMNPKATYFRNKNKQLRISLNLATATGNAPLIAILKARLAALRVQRVAFRWKQYSLITKAKMASQYMQSVLRTQLTPLSVQAPSGLALSASPPYDLTPNYYPQPLFETKQMVYVLWQQHIPFITSWFTRFPIALKRTCASTLKRRRSQWRTVLKMDKSSLNSYF